MKIAAFVSALLLGAAICTAAQAQSRRAPTMNYGYVFAEYDYYNATGGSLNGGGLGAGWRLSRHFAVQGGGQYSRKSGVDLTNGYIEGLLHFPLGNRASVYGAIGGAYLSASTNTAVGTVSVSRGGYRAGAGLEYWIAPQWSLRAGYRRQNTFGVFDDISVGLGFRF